jgi:hypothetical protein
MMQEPDHSFPSNTKVKNARGCTFIPPTVDITRVLKSTNPNLHFSCIFSKTVHHENSL